MLNMSGTSGDLLTLVNAEEKAQHDDDVLQAKTTKKAVVSLPDQPAPVEFVNPMFQKSVDNPQSTQETHNSPNVILTSNLPDRPAGDSTVVAVTETEKPTSEIDKTKKDEGWCVTNGWVVVYICFIAFLIYLEAKHKQLSQLLRIALWNYRATEKQ